MEIISQQSVLNLYVPNLVNICCSFKASLTNAGGKIWTAVVVVLTRLFTETRLSVVKAATVCATVHATVDVLTRHV